MEEKPKRVIRTKEQVKFDIESGFTTCIKCGELKANDRMVKRGSYIRNLCKDCKNKARNKGKVEFVLPESRVCKECGIEKPTSSFYKNGKGTYLVCIPCRNEIERQKNINKVHVGATKVCSKCGTEKPAEEFNKYYGGLAKWCKQCGATSSKNHYINNKEKVVSRVKEWKGNNKDKVYTSVRNRKAAKKGAVGTHTTEDIENLIVAQGGKCKYCGEDIVGNYHVDHIFPLLGKRIKLPNGHNYSYNLQLLCPSCNLSKNDRNPILHERNLGILTIDRFNFLFNLKYFMFSIKLTDDLTGEQFKFKFGV